MIDHQNVYREKHRASQHKQIARPDRKRTVNAEQVHSDHRRERADPHNQRSLPLQKDPENGSKNDIKRGDEAALPNRRPHDPELLKKACRRKRQPAASPAEQGDPPRDRLLFRVTRAAEKNHGKQHQPAEQTARGGKGERSHTLHALRLRNEGRPPDQRRQKEQKTVS